MINVLVADDHPVVREGLKQIIAQASDMRVGAEALNGQEVIDLLGGASFDVLILDLNMPGRDGFEVLRQVRRDHPRLPVLILTVHAEEHVGVRVLRAGAAGIMNKESAPAELINALRRIVGGRKYISEALAERLAFDAGIPGLPHEALSDREYQVLCLVASGKTIAEIAQFLALSDKTIRTYRERILAKLGLKNDVELVHYALRHKLIGAMGD